MVLFIEGYDIAAAGYAIPSLLDAWRMAPSEFTQALPAGNVGLLLGSIVRLHDDSSGETAEFAILMGSRLKGHGVGWLLMMHMIEFSKHKDLKTVRGQVLAENSTMLAMCAELGFHVADDPDDRGVQDGDTASPHRTPRSAMITPVAGYITTVALRLRHLQGRSLARRHGRKLRRHGRRPWRHAYNEGGANAPIADFPINTICLHEQFDTDLLSVWVAHAGR